MKTIYVDTSVFGGKFDEEFGYWTQKFFDQVIATIQKADLLVSWNFKHIVNIERIHGYNAVNLKKGFQTLEIRNPREAFDYEDKN